MLQTPIHNFLHNWLCDLYDDNHPDSKSGSPYLTQLGQEGTIDELQAAIADQIILAFAHLVVARQMRIGCQRGGHDADILAADRRIDDAAPL